MNKNKEVIECILDEECTDCKLATGIGQLLNVCDTLGGDDCEVLHDKIMSEEMFPEELIEIMTDRSKGTQQHEIVSEIVDLMS